MGQEVKQETRQEGGIIITGEQEEGRQLSMDRLELTQTHRQNFLKIQFIALPPPPHPNSPKDESPIKKLYTICRAVYL